MRIRQARKPVVSSYRSKTIALITLLVSIAYGQTNCPNPPAVTTNSPQVPSDVCIPDGFTGNPIAFLTISRGAALLQ